MTCHGCQCMQELIEGCLRDDHTQRPSFDAICEALAGLIDEQVEAAGQAA